MKADKNQYYIVSNEGKAITSGWLATGQELSTKFNIDLFDIYQDYLDACKGFEIEPTEEVIIEVPQTITPAQGRIMLSRLGKLEEIENMIQYLDRESQIFWEYALTWNRSNAIVIQLSNQFGFDIDNLFIEASKIE